MSHKAAGLSRVIKVPRERGSLVKSRQGCVKDAHAATVSHMRVGFVVNEASARVCFTPGIEIECEFL